MRKLCRNKVRKPTQGQITFRWWSYNLRLDLKSCGPNCSTRYCYMPSATILVSAIITSYLCSAESLRVLCSYRVHSIQWTFWNINQTASLSLSSHLAALHCTEDKNPGSYKTLSLPLQCQSSLCSVPLWLYCSYINLWQFLSTLFLFLLHDVATCLKCSSSKSSHNWLYLILQILFQIWTLQKRFPHTL